MLVLRSLKSATSLDDLAALLGYSAKGLSFVIYQIPAEQRYTTFKIKKKDGGEREIKAPNEHLKAVQKRLSALLYECRAETEKERAGPVSHGFRRGLSIVTNAQPHKSHRYVLNIDLENFFPSFNFGRVRGFFIKDNAFALDQKVATIIAQIACDGEALPQGSPCSPIISDLIGQILDMRLVRFAKKHRVTYTRYADDLTFSTNQREFPAALAVRDTGNLANWTLGEPLVQKIEGTDFKINNSKTRMHCRGSRQLVTGLTVNTKVNIRSEYYRKARAMCQSLLQTGQFYVRMLPLAEGENEPKPEILTRTAPLEGVMSHIYYVKGSADLRTDQEQRDKPNATAKLFRRLLFYKYFARPEQPLIVGEGKTDGVYLREAIKHLPQFQPGLGAFDGDEQAFKLAVRLFRYSRLAHNVLGIGGGTGDLITLLLDYRRVLKGIQHRPMAHPVILVVDNDDGLAPIASTIKKNFKVTISTATTDPFYHIAHNLYLVKVPESPAGHTCIENLFPPELLEKELEGKRFNLKKAHGAEGEYGKAEFAEKIVRPSAHTIDFTGFVPLLTRIEAAVAHHQSWQSN